MFMKLDWGNVLKFADEREYYEVLGFLAKDEEYIRVYTESNFSRNDKFGNFKKLFCFVFEFLWNRWKIL